VVAEHAPLISGALPYVGHRAIRNRGTVCGSLAHADPSAELPAVALALEARMIVAGSDGDRMVPAEDFFQGVFTADLSETELLRAVYVPAWSARSGWSVRELSRRHGDFAIVGLACAVELDEDGAFAKAALAYFGVAGRPTRVGEAEAVLVDVAQVQDVRRGREHGVQRLEPAADLHGSSSYRKHIAGLLARQCLAEAAERAADRAAGRTSEPSARTEPGHERRQPQDHPDGHGTEHTVDVAPRRHLADVLREELGLTGTHLGCEHGVCGACTVAVDGEATRSCLVLAVQVDGSEITTIEGLTEADGTRGLIQRAMWEKHAFQCAFCAPGFMMSMSTLLADNPAPKREEIKEVATRGTSAAATGYHSILEGATEAVAMLAEQRASSGEASDAANGAVSA